MHFSCCPDLLPKKCLLSPQIALSPLNCLSSKNKNTKDITKCVDRWRWCSFWNLTAKFTQLTDTRRQNEACVCVSCYRNKVDSENGKIEGSWKLLTYSEWTQTTESGEFWSRLFRKNSASGQWRWCSNVKWRENSNIKWHMIKFLIIFYNWAPLERIPRVPGKPSVLRKAL